MTATALRLDQIEMEQSPAPALADTQSAEAVTCTLVAGLRARLARPVESRSPAGLSVELDVAGSYACASWQADRCRVRLAMLTDTTAASEACRNALATLLDRTASAVVGVVHDESSPALEVEVAGDTASPEFLENLATAFEALTVAARMAVAEAEVLATDEAVALRYLDCIPSRDGRVAAGRLVHPQP